MMNNPFKFDEPVTGSYHLDRDESSEIIANAKTHEHTAIYGERHIGKSSLLAETARSNARDFIFVKVDGRAIADENQFLDCFTSNVIRAGIGKAWGIEPALGDLLSTRRMRAALLSYGDIAAADRMRVSVPGKAEARSSKPDDRAAPAVQMCPRCGRPLKWIETYGRHYCYSCKKYAPKRTKRPRDSSRVPKRLSDKPEPCPRCGSPMRYVHRYSDHFCPGCGRYPLIDRVVVPEPWVTQDMDAALDLPQRLAELKGKPVVVMLDDIDDVHGLSGGRLVEAMRLKFEEHDDVVYVFASGSERQARRMFDDRKGAFFKFARTVEIRRIPDAKMQRFLTRRFRHGGGRLTEDAAKRIAGVSEGIPAYAQHIGHELFDISADPEMADVDAAIQKTVRQCSMAYELLWDSIRSPLHRRYLFAIAREPKAPHGKAFIRRYGLRSRSHVQRIQTQLEARGIIKDREIIDPMFVTWIRLSNAL